MTSGAATLVAIADSISAASSRPMRPTGVATAALLISVTADGLSSARSRSAGSTAAATTRRVREIAGDVPVAIALVPRARGAADADDHRAAREQLGGKRLAQPARDTGDYGCMHRLSIGHALA